MRSFLLSLLATLGGVLIVAGTINAIRFVRAVPDAPSAPATIAAPSASPWSDALCPLPRPEPDPKAIATRAALERLAARLADADARCRKLEAALGVAPKVARTVPHREIDP